MATVPLPTVDLLLPGLLPTQRVDAPATPLPRLPTLELLLARGDRATLNETSAVQWLMRRFGVNTAFELPAGALSLLGDGGEPGDAHWLRADPVHLRLHRDQLILADHRVFEISQVEAEAITDALNRHFTQDGFVFYPLRPERWYLRLAVPPAIVTRPPADAIGRHIDPLLPCGPDALAWHRLCNEIQMLLHDLPVNAERESRGVLAVNSVWLWGGGLFPTALARPYALVIASDPVARGLARAAGCAVATPDRDIGSLLADRTPGDVLWYDPDLHIARAYGDDAALAAALERLEQTVFAPLLDHLKGGQLARIRIVTFAESGGDCFETTRASLWRFWRSVMALSHYAVA
jgi:hypothetical protein